MRKNHISLAASAFLATVCIVVCMTATSASGAADLANGKALYENPALGGGRTGKTCKTCHEDGRDLSPGLLAKKDFQVMGIKMQRLEDVVNFCIEVTLRGEGVDPKGRDMADLIGYLDYLANKKPLFHQEKGLQ